MNKMETITCPWNFSSANNLNNDLAACRAHVTNSAPRTIRVLSQLYCVRIAVDFSLAVWASHSEIIVLELQRRRPLPIDEDNTLQLSSFRLPTPPYQTYA